MVRQMLPATVVGILYFALGYAIESDFSWVSIFVFWMSFLPGLTFPLTTCYFNTGQLSHKSLRVTSHLISSIAIYSGSVWLFVSFNGKRDWIASIDGFLGSSLFLIATRLILKFPIKVLNILICVIISGLVFAPSEIWGADFRLFGAQIFTWTIVNAYVIIESKKHLLTTHKK